MSREVRRVPPGWVHPSSPDLGVVNGNRRYRPSFDPMFYDDMVPLFDDAEPTHWQMYEIISEGTPLSPPMESPEALARWLSDNGAVVFADMTATHDEWLGMISGSGATVGASLNTRTGEWSPGWLDGQADTRQESS